MIAWLVRLELSRWRRDLRVLLTLVATAVVLIASTVWATAEDIARHEAHVTASEQARAAWEARGDIHAHSMAHFGDYVFRPGGPLAQLDRGVQARLGKVLYIEAHRQGAPLFADASAAGPLARYARPDAAFLLQVVVPLLLLFLGGTGLASDRVSGRLKLALVQGARAHTVALSRMISMWCVGLAALLLVVASALVTSSSLSASAAIDPGRLAAFVGIHALYLAVVSAAIVATSVWTRDVRSSLVTLLALWVLATAIGPRVTSGAISAALPLPSQDEFQSAMQASRDEGPDGHDPRDETLAQLRADILAEYGVSSADQLPIDIGGLMMQADEVYGNMVWDIHYGALQDQLTRQTDLSTHVALLNPYQATDVLSLAAAGTDLDHDLHFQRAAEEYRRWLVATLNDEHAHGRARLQNSRNSSADFFAALDAFEYEPPSIAAALRPRLAALAALVVWFFAMLAATFVGARRLERGRLPC